MSDTTAAALPAQEPFPTWRIVLFALGGIGTTIIASLTGLITYFYVPPETSQAAFPTYLTTKTFLGLTIVGLVGYVGGLTTIFLGPLISSWSDRSRSRLGRRRVFMIVSFIPLSVFCYLLFTPPVDGVSPLNAVYLLAVVIILNVFRTLNGVSGAIVPEFGSTSRIIMRFSTFTAIGWLMGFVLGTQGIYVIKEALTNSGMSPVKAFRITVGGLVAISALLSLVQILVIDEKRYGSGASSSVKLLPALKRAFLNRTFVLFILTQQVYFWGDGLFQAGLVYFVTLLFKLPESMMLVFGGAMVAISLVLYPLVGLASRRVGKKNLFSLALALMVVVMALFAFSDKVPIPPGILAWVIVAVAAIPNGITGIVPGAIGNEIVREDCIRTGDANEATFGAASGLITAIPAGIPGLVMPTLLIVGKSVSNPTGVRLVAVVSACCMLAAFVMLRVFYNEKKLRESLKAHGYV